MLAGSLPERRRAATRAEILATAEVLFLKNGLRGTSMGQVADAVGLGRASLYYYFPSKDDLLQATVHAIAARFRILDDIAVATTLRSTMRDITEDLIRALTGPDAGLRLLLTELIEQLEAGADQRVVAEFTSQFRENLADLIGRAQDSGEVAASVNPTQVAGRHLAKFLGIEIMRLIDPEFDFTTAVTHAEREFLAEVGLADREHVRPRSAPDSGGLLLPEG